MIKQIYPKCGKVNSNVKGWEKRKYANKENKKVIYYLHSYTYNECNSWFITPVNFELNSKTGEKIKLDEKKCKIHANTDLSFDKITEVIELTMNINISPQYIINMI
jgi:hypothetical protein